jgi:hypothetical protein
MTHKLNIGDSIRILKLTDIDSRNMPLKEHIRAQISKKINDVMVEYSEEYQVLADKSEKLYDEQEALKKEYEVLDKKTKLQALMIEIERLSKS